MDKTKKKKKGNTEREDRRPEDSVEKRKARYLKVRKMLTNIFINLLILIFHMRIKCTTYKFMYFPLGYQI